MIKPGYYKNKNGKFYEFIDHEINESEGIDKVHVKDIDEGTKFYVTESEFKSDYTFVGNRYERNLDKPHKNTP